MLFLIAALALLPTEGGPFKPVRVYAAPDEDADAFLQDPADLGFDASGRLYLLDVVARRIFVWAPDGTFLHVGGKEGNGPGEFVFSPNRSGRTGRSGNGHLSVVEDRLYVFDRRKGEIMVFDTELNLKQTHAFRPGEMRPQYVAVIDATTVLMVDRRYKEGGFVYQTLLLNMDGSTRKLLSTCVDKSRTITGTRGSGNNRRPNFSVTAFSPHPVAQWDPVAKRVLLGYGLEPSAAYYDAAGNLLKNLTPTLPRKEVTAADKAEYHDRDPRDMGRRARNRTVNFPDQKAWFDDLLPLADGRMLAYTLSPTYGNLDGYLLNPEGRPVRPVQHKLGTYGRLFARNGRLVAVSVDDAGDYRIAEIAL